MKSRGYNHAAEIRGWRPGILKSIHLMEFSLPLMPMHENTICKDQMGASLSQAALLLKQARLLISRLERLTPDSAWARRASGCRGTLIRLVGRVEAGSKPSRSPTAVLKLNHKTTQDLKRVLDQGFTIFHAAARESLTK